MKNLIYSALILSALTLTACSKDNFEGDEPKDWSNTTEVYIPTDETGFSTYYTPAIGRVGDPMPFYDAKTNSFKVMYLQEYDNNSEYRFHPIWAVETTDGANYNSLGEWISVGGSDTEQDAALGTGCCFFNEQDGLYYIYYTGHNTQLSNVEAVMRATSTDCKTWTKDNLWTLYGKDYGYSTTDFRDPQIFKEGSVYHMIIATRPINGGDPCFADFTSTDMKQWTKQESIKMIWDRMLECPDVFQMGNKWYCVYSESVKTSWSRKVKYMMADSWEDLKKCFNDGPKWPADDREGVLDSRAFYAGKTASNGTDRYIWGWSPYRSGADIYEKNVNVGGGDGNEPNWSGSLVCHKLIQHEDGTLSVCEVPGIKAKYNKSADVKIMKQTDDYTLYSRLGTHNHISFTVKTTNDGDKFGISFVRSEDATKFYTLVLNPEWENGRRKVNFEEEGPEGMGFIDGADGYIIPRPANNTYKVDIYTDNSVLTMYINGEYGYTQRIYGIQNNCWSINNYGNNIEISDLSVSKY